MSLYTNYIKYNKNYWQRKLIDNPKNFGINLIKKNNLTREESKNLFKKYVEIINLETSAYCNRVCPYCPVSIYERKDKSIKISESILSSVITALKEIDYAKRISLNLYNEPLYNNFIFEVLSKLNRELPNSVLHLNSNGDYIKGEDTLLKLEQSGLKEILITLHTPPKSKWKKSSRQKALKRFAKKIKFNLLKNHLNNLEFETKFGKKLFCKVVCNDYSINSNGREKNVDGIMNGRTRGGIIDSLKPQMKRNLPCLKPFREFTIYYDGSVTPCCEIYHDEKYKKYIMGQILSNNPDSVFKVYTGKLLTKFRESVFSYSMKTGPCSTCVAATNEFENIEIDKDIKSRETIISQISKER